MEMTSRAKKNSLNSTLYSNKVCISLTPFPSSIT
jgi:hypothetical protein